MIGKDHERLAILNNIINKNQVEVHEEKSCIFSISMCTWQTMTTNIQSKCVHTMYCTVSRSEANLCVVWSRQ